MHFVHFRIQQQHLINVPQNHARHKGADQNVETQRILNEIQRINVNFGYIKQEPQTAPRIDLESYFYPHPAYHPIHQRYNNGVTLPPTIRQLNVEKDSSQSHPFNTQTYYYPTPYLQVPYAETAQLFQRTDKSENFRSSSKGMTGSGVENDLIEYAPQHGGVNRKLVRDYNQERELVQAVKKIVNEIKETNKSQPLDIAVIINKITDESRANHKKQHQKKLFGMKAEDDDSVVINAKEKLSVTTLQPTTVNSKTFFSRPKPVKANTGSTNLKTKESPQVIANEAPEVDSPVPLASVKGPFSNFVNSQKEQVVEALRHGGIIIQRLRVREGGIAIAGPGRCICCEKLCVLK